ncbi:hypothetical protein ABZX74_28830 [Streptomyces olivaceoviridis]|uniref:hypothetical protein n=1 Tax=Streptomyces olivaceoviridis TaxID=1921 RepID=UPI00339E4F69
MKGTYRRASRGPGVAVGPVFPASTPRRSGENDDCRCPQETNHTVERDKRPILGNSNELKVAIFGANVSTG